MVLDILPLLCPKLEQIGLIMMSYKRHTTDKATVNVELFYFYLYEPKASNE